MNAASDLAGGRLTIDLGALVSNWNLLARKAGTAECAAVVKANAYGCGVEPVVGALWKAGCKTFFVALPEEAMRVKNAAPGARCFVLGGLYANTASYFQQQQLIPVLGSLTETETALSFAKDSAPPLPCALHIDTGMNRLGFTHAEFSALVADKNRMQHLDPKLLISHYACADDIEDEKTAIQRALFVEAAKLLPDVPLSVANSAATLREEDHAFDLVRPGIALYGGSALNHIENPMSSVVTLEGRIIQIRTAHAGETVGYGGTEVLTRDTRVAYVAVGYADGYHRAASNKGVPVSAVTPRATAAFKGQIIKGLGRISMDMSAFDVTDIPADEIAAGDWIELFGNTVDIDKVASAAGTIGYELLTALGERYFRIYRDVGT